MLRNNSKNGLVVSMRACAHALTEYKSLFSNSLNTVRLYNADNQPTLRHTCDAYIEHMTIARRNCEQMETNLWRVF